MIYVLEDDNSILELILYALKSQNIEAKGFSEPLALQEAIKEEIPQILILDVMLPGISGFEILREIKNSEKTKGIAVLMLSALNSELDKVKGLDCGADDYITKPFGVMEFLARIRALLRRVEAKKDEIIFGELEYSSIKHSVTLRGKKVDLTLKEFEILGLLLKNIQRAFSRDEILEILWGDSYNAESRRVDIHIKTLRQKLGDFGEHIKTIRGIGYQFSREI
ncbi:response regulator transcription factor [Helicobacter pullorum]|uniref:Response regulator receiver domain protein n=2 Tax=Helicobacter pullorum TaxID=35818 RepID=C5F0Z2_9HELI|nr:response regulator transcription factor [Helicobacter pullorum]HIS09165.1 response regulator transcription factor [Candidatus Scatomorpha intestinipullorum]EEQ63896.1 response regulator receiver domain protein [Helicobacter pullorum MIT 98-5489]KPH51954.1 ArsR family transcriptional regulator [Helicobacter pullorum]KPH52789.1 ArsR family transcriptional regulator [Helicobacter pullorum]OCR03704.1 DNA-binding response regulator [Helicobacter pullorum]